MCFAPVVRLAPVFNGSTLCDRAYRHFNHHVYNFDEIFVPGGLVLGLTLSAANRDLHEVLHEDLAEVVCLCNDILYWCILE